MQPNSDKLKVSIVVPVYNVEKYLAVCLDSLIGQTYENIEIILVNDGSTDSCLQICQKYSEMDRRIMLINQENKGLSEARNAAFSHISGEYVCFTDSDDLIHPDFVKTLLETGLKSDADITECDFIKFENEDEPVRLRKEIKNPKIEIYDKLEALELLLSDRIRSIVCNKLYKRELIGPILFEKDRINEDQFWTHQIFAMANKTVHADIPLYYYRIHSESIMGQKYSFMRLDEIEAMERQVEFFSLNYPSLAGAAVRRLHYSVLKHYRRLKKSGLEGEDQKRRELIGILKKYNLSKNMNGWALREKIRYKLLVCCPELTYLMTRYPPEET